MLTWMVVVFVPFVTLQMGQICIYILGCEQSACCCSHQVRQMVESHREAVFPSRGLLVVLDDRPQVPLPHCSPEEDLRLNANARQVPGWHSAGK